MSENENATPDADETPPPESAAAESCSTECSTEKDPSIGTPRRNFVVEMMAAGVGALVGIVPAAIGGLFFLDPLFRKKADGEGDGFVETDLVLDALPADGTPIRYTVRDDLINAWNMTPDQPIGAAWLRRIQDQVLAFSTVCPHLGCDVEHRPGNGDFFCPCHTSAFDLDGEPLNDIPPRAMDTLEATVKDGRIWLKYESFRGATSKKVPV